MLLVGRLKRLRLLLLLMVAHLSIRGWLLLLMMMRVIGIAAVHGGGPVMTVLLLLLRCLPIAFRCFRSWRRRLVARSTCFEACLGHGFSFHNDQ